QVNNVSKALLCLPRHAYCDVLCRRTNSKMTTTQIQKKIGAMVLGISMIIGIGFAMSTTAQAQYPQYPSGQRDRRDREQDRDNRGRDNGRWRRRGNDDYPNWGGSFQLRQTALNAGFNEGL